MLLVRGHLAFNRTVLPPSNDLARRVPDYVTGIRHEAARPLMERPMTDYALAYDPAAMLAQF